MLLNRRRLVIDQPFQADGNQLRHYLAGKPDLLRSVDFGFGLRRRVHLRIAQAAKNFEHFAARGEHAAAGSLVAVERVHEFNFVVVVVPLAGGRVDLPAAVHFLAALKLAAFDSDRGGPNATFTAAPVFLVAAAIDGLGGFRFRHGW